MDAPFNVLTIATGKKLYLDMAINLSRSFWLWNAGTGICFYLATDQPLYVPEDIKTYAKIIVINPGEFGEGFSPKLHLDKLAPPGHTLFIDSDCLVYGNLEKVFEKFYGHSVSVLGSYISSGEWFGDIEEVCKKFNIEKMPKFNGGIYYIEKGDKASKVYQTARQSEARYDEIGFVRFRGHPADEQIMSLAMALNNEHPIIDDGSIMSDPLSCPGDYTTDIIKGKTTLYNPPKPSPLHQAWYPFKMVHPLIIHFLGHHSLSYQYKKDAYLLHAMRFGKVGLAKKVTAKIQIEWPMKIKILLKNFFRPVYKLLFGIRAVTPSERMVS